MEPVKYQVKSTKADVKVRKLPGAEGKFTGDTLKNGTTVMVMKVKDGWSKIEAGWVYSKYLVKMEEPVTAKPGLTRGIDTTLSRNVVEPAKFTHQPIIFPEKDKLILRTALLASPKGATFGMTRSYADGRPKPHQGIDLEVPPGEPIFAVENGVIVDKRVSKDYGNILCLSVTEGFLKGKFFFYAHLNETHVNIGTKVKAGDRIGLTGSTGNASAMKTIKTGSHLHFEARTVMQAGLGLAGRYDPLPFIRLK
jgi:murein DD-endopeptidase MepM/ murein hydrolase activator NlpD